MGSWGRVTGPPGASIRLMTTFLSAARVVNGRTDKSFNNYLLV